MYCHLAVLMAKNNPRQSQRDLAKELQISHTTVNKLYNGHPFNGVVKSEIVEKICLYFSCDVGELFSMVDASLKEG